MHLIMLHYHLNRGGVTRVIENHLRSLSCTSAPPEKVTVVCGGRMLGWNSGLQNELPFEVELRSIMELDYDSETQSQKLPLYDALKPILTTHPKDSSIVHVHNHSLGKNVALLRTLNQLADDGWRLLLQIHDFAEDLRPANYRHMVDAFGSTDELHSKLYPQAANVHYATLNNRDRQILEQSGVVDQRLHLIPNPVDTDSTPASSTKVMAAKSRLHSIFRIPRDRRYILYPVRGIRRKNIGEVLLWSLLVNNATFAITLAPLNPTELASYQAWAQLSKSLKLPVLFHVGRDGGLSLEENYAAANAIITTSVAEGFGLVYLEAELAGRRLMGRKLQGITTDFEAAGMQFPFLSETLCVPSELIDRRHLADAYFAICNKLQASFGITTTDKSATRAAVNEILDSETIDFGRLDVDSQKEVIQQVKADAKIASRIRQLNPIIEQLESDDWTSEARNAQNRYAIEQHYSFEVIGEKLLDVYHQISTCPSQPVQCQPQIARKILEQFVDPRRIFPIRIES